MISHPQLDSLQKKKKADATNVAGEKESCRMSFFSFPFKSLLKMSIPCSLTYYFPRYVRGNIHSKESNFCSPNAVFFLCSYKSVAMYVRYREYITFFLWKMFLLLLVKMKILIHMQIFMGIWFCFWKILQSRNWKCHDIFSKLQKMLMWNSRQILELP